jgi:hypothetical protein
MALTQELRAKIRSIRQTNLYWRYGANLAPTVHHFVRTKKERSDVISKIVDQLNSDGIAVARIEDLLSAEMIANLESQTRALLTRRVDDINDLRSTVDRDSTIGKKTFNLELLGSEPEFEIESVFANLGLSGSMLAIADSYLRMTAQLRYFNVWYTTASTGISRESQLWHFDREDNYILKAFLYLDDVDEGTGPFTYAPGTHRNGKYRSIQPEFIMEGNVKRTTDEQMTKVYPREKWKVGTGKKGTIVFADTRGYHKGGEARTKDRLMFTCMYTSPASQSKDLIRFPEEFDSAGLSYEQSRALRIPKK